VKIVKISNEAHAQLARLARLYERPMGRIVELQVAGCEAGLRVRMTPEEFARYLREGVSFAEGRRIRAREAEKDPLQPPGPKDVAAGAVMWRASGVSEHQKSNNPDQSIG
jgi:hypothetical protein